MRTYTGNYGRLGFQFEGLGYSSLYKPSKSLYSQFPIGSGTEFSWDNKEAGANLMMYKITGDSQYLQKFNQFKTTINNGSKTPGGMWFIQQWGSVRHAANAAFLFASSGDKAAAKEQIDFILGKRALNRGFINYGVLKC